MTRITHQPGGGSSIVGGIFGTDSPSMVAGPAAPATPEAPAVEVHAFVAEPVKGVVDASEAQLKVSQLHACLLACLHLTQF